MTTPATGAPPTLAHPALATWALGRRNRLTRHVLAPAALCLAVLALVLYFAGQTAVVRVNELGAQAKALRDAGNNPFQTAAVLVQHRYGDAASPADRARYTTQIRAALELAAHPGEAAKKARGWIVLFAVLTFSTVLLFPLLFVVQAYQASAHLHQLAARRSSASGSLAGFGFHEIAGAMRSIRYLHQESAPHFFRRLYLCAFLSVVSMKMWFPGGVDDALWSQFAGTYTLPGEQDGSALINNLRGADPLVSGFFGYFLYAVQLHVRRMRSLTLSQSMLLPLLSRGVFVFAVGLVITTVERDGGLGRVLAFIAGIVPEAAATWLSKLTSASVERITGEPQGQFREIREIDFWKEAALAELGIDNLSDLARCDGKEVLETAAIAPAVLLRALDRALLLDYFGPEAARKLERVPAYGATELLLYARGEAAWRSRWIEAEPRYKMGAEIPGTPAEREKRACELLGMESIAHLVTQLEADRNVQLVMDNKLNWGGV